MAREPGQEILECRRATMESDGTGEPGDFVALSGGQVTQADGTDDPKFTGVISDSKDNIEGFEAGDKISVIIGGVCVATVTAGVASGDGLGPSATEGAATSGGSEAEAFSDAGGEFLGSIPDGAAAVHLEGGS